MHPGLDPLDLVLHALDVVLHALDSLGVPQHALGNELNLGSRPSTTTWKRSNALAAAWSAVSAMNPLRSSSVIRAHDTSDFSPFRPIDRPHADEV